MRVELVFQHLVLVADIFRLKLFVLNEYLLLAVYQMDDITTAGDKTRHDEIPQRMQIMVYHRVDSWNIERFVQEDKDLSQQITQYPRQDEREQNLCSRNLDRRLVEMEQPCIDSEKQEQRQKSKEYLISHIHKLHSGK